MDMSKSQFLYTVSCHVAVSNVITLTSIPTSLSMSRINSASLSPLDRLAYIGNYAMGALSYEPKREVENSVDDIILDDLAKSSHEILEGSSDVLLDELLS